MKKKKSVSPRVLVFGTPWPPNDYFLRKKKVQDDSEEKKRTTIKITAEDSPNISLGDWERRDEEEKEEKA